MKSDSLDPIAGGGTAAGFLRGGPAAVAILRLPLSGDRAALEPATGDCAGDPAERGADLLDRHRRLIAAWCEDLASGDLRRTGRAPRADAICGVSDEDDRGAAPPALQARSPSARRRALD